MKARARIITHIHITTFWPRSVCRRLPLVCL